MEKPIQDGKLQSQYEWRREQSISDKVGQLLVDQIPRELHNHNIYRTYQNYFSLIGLERLAKYYELRALEEYEHHKWIIDYLNESDFPFAYPATPVTDVEIPDNIQPFKDTVDLEIETTEYIFEIVNAAKEENDWQTVDWLYRLLVREQHEEESTSRTALDIIQTDASWLTKSKYILNLLEKED